MRALVALAVIAGATAAAPDGLAAFKGKLREVERAETAFWDEYQGRKIAAHKLFEIPTLRAHTEPDYPQDARPDYTGLRALYDDYDALQRRRGEAYAELARSRDARAAETLLDELMAAAKRIDELEVEIAGMKPGSRIDLRPGIERHGLETRMSCLGSSLAACPDAVPFLTAPAWTAAVKKDAKRSFERRIAVLDALGATRNPAAVPFLAEAAKAPASSLRIAALEALAGLGPDAGAALTPLLVDKSPVVCIALLQTVRARDAANRAWISPVHESYRASAKRLRAEHVKTLEALSGRQYGDDAERWAAWHRKVEESGGADNADLEKIDVESPKRSDAADAVRFYGFSARSDRLVYVLDGSYNLHLPADADVQATRCQSKWGARSKGYWKDEWVDHATVLRAQLLKSIDSMPAQSRFAVVALRDNAKIEALGEGRLLAPDARGKRDVEQLLERLPGNANHLGPLDGLIEAMRVAGLDPTPGAGDFPEMKADTVFLLDQGSPAWGCYWTAESTLRAFRRLNRFRRLAVIAVKIYIADKEEEALMQGLAETSGGAYRWQRKPP